MRGVRRSFLPLTIAFYFSVSTLSMHYFGIPGIMAMRIEIWQHSVTSLDVSLITDSVRDKILVDKVTEMHLASKKLCKKKFSNSEI